MFDYHFLFFIYAFIYAHDPIPCLITVVLTLQFEWSAESSSWATASHNVISPPSRIGGEDPISTEKRSNDCNWRFSYYTKTILCRCSWRPNYWPSSFSAGSTQPSYTFRYLSPWPDTIDTIDYVFAPVGRALLGASKFQLSWPLLRGYTHVFYDGQYTPNYIS